MNRRAETDNLSKTNIINKANNDSKKDLRATTQVIVETRHRGYGMWYGGGGLLLVIILVIILV
jgi:hypothetical protein